MAFWPVKPGPVPGFFISDAMQTLITHLSNNNNALQRGWQLGDGHFTTIHAYQGRLCHWSYHQARLAEAGRKLQLAELDWSQLYQRAVNALDGSDQVLRITVVRGRGARGYGIAGSGCAQVMLTTTPFPAHYYQWQQHGLQIGVCDGRLGTSPLLAGLKTINRLEQVVLKAELDAKGWPEAVVLNEQEHVCEGVSANIFWRCGTDIYTPALTNSGVWGTARAWCQKQLGERLKLTEAPLSELLRADEVWLTNALMGIMPVTGIAEQSFTLGALTQDLQKAFINETTI